VASLSLATDLGLGQPMEHVLRSCVLGLRIAEDLQLGESERAVVYYVALLAWLGCHADAHEQSARFGDDIQLRADRHLADTIDTRFVLGHVGRGEPPARRALRLGSLLVSGRDALAAMETTHCMIAGLFATRLGLGTEVRDGLQHVFERWDGKGTPAGIAGEKIALSARIVVIADIVESFRRLGGMPAAVDVARRRAGGQFDPSLAAHVCDNADALLGGLDEATGWDAAIAAEPALADEERVDEDAVGESEADRLDHRVVRQDEAGEDADHDQARSGDDRGRLAEAVANGVPGSGAVGVGFAHPGHQEDLIVHGQPEQDPDGDDRDEADDRRGLADAEQVGAEAVLEDADHGADGGSDGEQEPTDGGEWDEQRPERDRQQHEGERDDLGQVWQQRAAHAVGDVDVDGGLPVTARLAWVPSVRVVRWSRMVRARSFVATLDGPLEGVRVMEGAGRLGTRRRAATASGAAPGPQAPASRR
jgi:hypothetical protein